MKKVGFLICLFGLNAPCFAGTSILFKVCSNGSDTASVTLDAVGRFHIAVVSRSGSENFDLCKPKIFDDGAIGAIYEIDCSSENTNVTSQAILASGDGVLNILLNPKGVGMSCK